MPETSVYAEETAINNFAQSSLSFLASQIYRWGYRLPHMYVYSGAGCTPNASDTSENRTVIGRDCVCEHEIITLCTMCMSPETAALMNLFDAIKGCLLQRSFATINLFYKYKYSILYKMVFSPFCKSVFPTSLVALRLARSDVSCWQGIWLYAERITPKYGGCAGVYATVARRMHATIAGKSGDEESSGGELVLRAVLIFKAGVARTSSVLHTANRELAILILVRTLVDKIIKHFAKLQLTLYHRATPNVTIVHCNYQQIVKKEGSSCYSDVPSEGTVECKRPIPNVYDDRLLWLILEQLKSRNEKERLTLPLESQTPVLHQELVHYARTNVKDEWNRLWTKSSKDPQRMAVTQKIGPLQCNANATKIRLVDLGHNVTIEQGYEICLGKPKHSTKRCILSLKVILAGVTQKIGPLQGPKYIMDCKRHNTCFCLEFVLENRVVSQTEISTENLKPRIFQF
ncbi:hypothetical protein WN51_02425 [Melipona quadrifasciata]|uniref:Uncharacterized protein n=1 Tax=Melipona quadrifasciata TaxID=166423 RepID=A0A0N0BE94_9HYME|nr:hypothetical protein WN51_02425 [Melipona quadrifasciata]